jgi:hypothetical protein
MKFSRTSSSHSITLFSDRPEPSQRSSSFVVSILVHGGVLGLLIFGIVSTPQMKDAVVSERYTVRHLRLREPRPRSSGESGVGYPGPHRAVSFAASLKPPLAKDLAKKPAAQPAALREIALAPTGPQTLLQPDIPKPVTLIKEMPAPTVVIWSPQKTPAKDLVAPLPAPATASDVKPSADPPNAEVNLANIAISATDHAAPAQAILPSSTSPLLVHAPDLPQLAPVTTSESSAEPTPTAVMSLSDLRMPEGTVMLPPVNETAASASPGALAQGQAGNSSAAGNSGPAGAADAGQQKGIVKHGASAGAASGAGPESASGPGNQPSTDLIKLPRDGQFGAVVVGSSLEEKYPEAAALWSGRLVYTVYLHVGLAKSWILQYSLPRSGDAAEAGNIARLQAPWPYNIVRPNLPAGAINGDSLMVRGFVNGEGRFETPTIVFPPQFAQAQFVLDALKQWQFRPAMQDGQAARVEVLLIVPEEPE